MHTLWKDSFRPWQVRSIDAAPEKFLRTSDSPDRPSEILVEGGHVFRPPIGERPIGLRPDKLRRVELGGVGGEAEDLESRVVAEESLDFLAAVNGAPVPQEDHRPPQVPEEVVAERADLQPAEVPGPALEVEGQAAVPGRDRQAADDREAVAAVAVGQQRGLAFGPPRSYGRSG